MSSSEFTPYNLLRSKHALAIVGFGIYRRHSDQAVFHSSDFENALPSAIRKHVTPSKSHLTKMQELLSGAGYMSLRSASGLGGGRPRIFMEVEETAVEPMVDALVTRVTHAGMNLVDLLHVPESIETILTHTNFKERVISQVSGLAIEHS